MAVAYSEITLLNLTDSATYIYYAEDVNGMGASRTPTAASKYIGIYNGPQLANVPNEPTPDMTSSEYWSGWSKYVGEDGSGVTGYSIQASQNEMVKFYKKETVLVEGNEITRVQASFSPSKLSFQVVNGEEPTHASIDSIKLFCFLTDEEYNDTWVPFPLKSIGYSRKPESVAPVADEDQEKPDEWAKEIELPIKDYFSYNESSKAYEINFKNLTEFYYSNGVLPTRDQIELKEGEYQSYEEMIEWHRCLSEFVEKEPILKIQISGDQESEYNQLNKLVEIRYATSQDMAKLSVLADGIYASMDQAGLVFNEDGLTVMDSGFQIIVNVVEEKKDPYKKKIFSVENGGLYMEGTGTFTGAINATSGSFSGTVSASNGEIGGFSIGNSSITTSGLELYSSTENQDSKLIVARAELGESLKISDSVYIMSPTEEENKVLSIKNEDGAETLTITDEGKINLCDNNIVLDGLRGVISGDNWSIGTDQAYFKNITISGAIKAASFDYDSVSAVGGSLIVRPSGKIESVILKDDKVEIKLEGAIEGFEVGDTCLFSSESGSKYFEIIEKREDGLVFLDDSQIIDENYIGSVLINLGHLAQEKYVLVQGITNFLPGIIYYKKNEQGAYEEIGAEEKYEEGKYYVKNIIPPSVGIGINGSNNDSFIHSNAITVFERDESDDKINTKIILGKLPKFNTNSPYGDNFVGTYGLYAENVFLNGSLTTKTINTESTESYSGIGTALGASNAPTTVGMKDRFLGAAYEENGETKYRLGQILMWAGATGDSKEEVENSKFFVDQYGNMYAGSGYFDGTIITNSTIRASKIETLEISGYDPANKNAAALTIKDADVGIVFKGEGETTRFELCKGYIKANNIPIEITENGYLQTPQVKLIDGLVIEGKNINYLEKDTKIIGLTFAKDQTNASQHSFEINTNNEKIVSGNSSLFSVNKALYIGTDVFYGSNVEYRQVGGEGYDLYIN